MKVVDDDPFEFRAPNGVPSKCRIRIYKQLPCPFNRHDVIVIATQYPEGADAGMSITNAAETIATLVMHRYQIEPMSLIWIEHYPERGHRGEIKENVDRVTFSVGFAGNHQVPTIALQHAQWAPTERAFIERLIGETF
jgi:hypothetical protein